MDGVRPEEIEKKLIEDFLKWLDSKALSICNVSNAIWWPIRTDTIAERFVKQHGTNYDM
jgi:hypothetical protein